MINLHQKSGLIVKCLLMAVVLLLSTYTTAATQLNENCTVSVLNRTANVQPDGSWTLPNAPANMGQVRARATCVDKENGVTISGQSDFFTINANGVTDAGEIKFDNDYIQVPVSLSITSDKTTLTSTGDIAQLTVTATYPDDSTVDVTADSTGTSYTISNPAIATIDTDGLITAVSSGTVIVSSSNEAVLSSIGIKIELSGDADGDGLLDDYELANGLNPNNPVDASEDTDGDGLTNLEEFNLGTDLNSSDTDGDGIDDAEELVAGTDGYITDPTNGDSDGDGVWDGLEVSVGSDPTNSGSFDLSASMDHIDVTPSSFVIIYNTINTEATQQLTVTGTMTDDRTIDLTSTGMGTNYNSTDLTVASFGATAGLIYAGQDGTATITVTNNGFSDTAVATIQTFSPTALSYLNIPGSANNVDISGNYAYVAAGSAGLQVIDVSDRSNPSIAASEDTPGTANDVKVVGTTVFIADGSSGLQIMDISNPLDPVKLIPSGFKATINSAQDVVVAGNLAYVADVSGLKVIDISVPASPVIIGSVNTPGNAYGVDVNPVTSIAVIADRSRGIQVIDISDPLNPAIMGSVDTGDAWDVVLRDNYAFVADYSSSFTSVDISDPANPIVKASTNRSLGGLLQDAALSGRFAFGADIFFVNGVPIIDVSTPDTPIPRAILDFSSFSDNDGTGIAVDSNYVYLTTSGRRLYIGQYLDITDNAGNPPTVNITAPLDGDSVVEDTTLPITVNAEDDVAVVAVNFMIDGLVIFTDTSAPYQLNYTVPTGITGLIISATAIDLANNVGRSSDVIVNVIPDPLTTVIGTVTDGNGDPVSGATVDCLGATSLTASDGSFSIPDVSTILGDIQCTVSFTKTNGTVLSGESKAIPPVRGGNADIGTIIVNAAFFEDDFESGNLNNWIIGGRRQGTNIAEVVLRNDSNRAHLYHRTFTEINISRTFEYVSSLRFRFDMEANASSQASSTSNFYAMAYVSFSFIDNSGDSLGSVAYIRSTSSFPMGSTSTYAKIKIDDNNNYLYDLSVEELLSKITIDNTAISSVKVVFNTYASGWTYNMSANLWLDNFTVFKAYAPPTVNITSPLHNSNVIEGTTLQISAEATDDVHVTSVSFLIDGNFFSTDTAAPYQLNYQVPIGISDLIVSATAIDPDNNISTSSNVTVSVIPNPIPAVSITEPAACGVNVVEGVPLLINADATDNTGVTSVTFSGNGLELSVDTTPPYMVNTTIPIGITEYNIEAIAEDLLGRTNTAACSLSVLPDPIPTVSITEPAACGVDVIEGAPLSIKADATDNTGITSVTFNANGQELSVDTTPPYMVNTTIPIGITEYNIEAIAEDLLGKTNTAACSLSVIPDPPTTVIGRVVDANGLSVSGATVTTVNNLTATSISDGTFSIPDVPTISGSVSVSATSVINRFHYSGSVTGVAVISGGTTNVGSITILAEPDTDNDGMPDSYESANGLNPNDPLDAGQDPDSDGLSNLQEFNLGTDLRNSDTDNDGMPDAYESANGLNPNDPLDAGQDPDNDGLSNLQEFNLGTDPQLPNTYLLTTVIGIVVDAFGLAVEGATVATENNLTATTNADGAFSVPGVPAVVGDIRITATATVNGEISRGSSTAVPPVPGRVTNVGVIMISAAIWEDDYGTILSTCDDCNYNRALGFVFSFFGIDYTGVYVNTNGRLTFDWGDDTYLESMTEIWEQPQIAPFFDNLDPRQGGNMWINDTLPGKFVVTWPGVPHSQIPDSSNDVQVILFENGKIQFGYKTITGSQGTIVGISRGPFGTTSYLMDLSFARNFSFVDNLTEYFGNVQYSGDFDLDNYFVVFTPSVSGGYDVTATPPLILDTDGDGMPDVFEDANGLYKYWPGDAGWDLDWDGLTNKEEYDLGTDLRNRDTDADWMTDGQEVAAGTDPLVPTLSIEVDPSQLSFTGVEGGSNQIIKELEIDNGGVALSWTATVDVPWLTLSSTSGNLDPGSSVTINVTTDTSGITPGTYNANITVNAPGAFNAPQTVTVTLTVFPDTGRGNLFARNIVEADDHFKTDIISNPANQEANFFRSITRLLRIVEQNQDGTDPATFTDSLKEMMDQFGYSPGTRSIFDFSTSLPEDTDGHTVLPSDSPTGGNVQEFLRNVILPEINGAINENIAATDSSFSLVVSIEEMAGVDISEDTTVEIDFGDVKLLEALLNGLKAAILTTLAYDLDMDIDQANNLGDNLKIQQDVIDANASLLRLNADGAALLTQAKAAIIDGINAYLAGSAFIRAETDDQNDDFITIELEDLLEEASLRASLQEIKNSLSGGAPTVTIDTALVNISQLFDFPFDLRDLLPPIEFSTERENYIVPGTFPDPTLNGILPGMTQQELADDLNIE